MRLHARLCPPCTGKRLHFDVDERPITPREFYCVKCARRWIYRPYLRIIGHLLGREYGKWRYLQRRHVRGSPESGV